MSTTKPRAPLENAKVVIKDSVYVRDPEDIKQEQKQKSLNILYDRFSIFRNYNFIKSKQGEIRYFTKLGLNNSIKSHCLESCFIEKDVGGIMQSEKLCMLNCLTEGEDMYKGFVNFKSMQYSNYNDSFDLSKTVPIKRLV